MQCYFPGKTGTCRVVFDIDNEPYLLDTSSSIIRKTYELVLNQDTTLYLPISRGSEITSVVRASASSLQNVQQSLGQWYQEDEFRSPIRFSFVQECDDEGCWWTD